SSFCETQHHTHCLAVLGLAALDPTYEDYEDYEDIRSEFLLQPEAAGAEFDVGVLVEPDARRVIDGLVGLLRRRPLRRLRGRLVGRLGARLHDGRLATGLGKCGAGRADEHERSRDPSNAD